MSADVSVAMPKDYVYRNCGLSGVHLLGDGVRIIDCTSCGKTTTTILQEAQLLQVLGLAIVLRGPGITGEQVRYLRKLFELTQDAFARALGKARRETQAEWEALGPKRLFKASYEELSLRVMLMAMFEKHVLESEFCCLSPDHKRVFADAAGRFIQRAPVLVAASECRKPIRIRRPRRSGNWTPARCFAC